jgi:endonuclease-8
VEGPSLVILRKELRPFVGKPVIEVSGNTTLEVDQFAGQKLTWVKTWGKHLLLRIGKQTLRVHFLLWGSYSINAPKYERPRPRGRGGAGNDRDEPAALRVPATPRSPRLHLKFESGDVYFYACSMRFIEQSLTSLYDWRVDVMSRAWDSAYVRGLVKTEAKEYVADVLLDQDIFAGVGNIIKNEVLWNLRMHPLKRVEDLKPRELTAFVEEAHRYSHQFYRWKKRYVLRKHWNVYHKGVCPREGAKLIRKSMGKRDRYTFYCPVCQTK